MMEIKEQLKAIMNQFDFKSDFLYSGLTEKEEVYVRSLFETIHFKKGSKLFYEDGIPTGVFMIETGIAKKYKTVIGKQEQIFYIYTKGDLLGYHALLSDERYQDSCEAIEDMKVNFLSKDNFLLLMNKLPTLKSALIYNLAHEFGVLANTISILAQKSQNIRLALFLLILESRYKKAHPEQPGILMSRFDLANLIGATRESLGRLLKDFKERGLITIESKAIHLADHNSLVNMLYPDKRATNIKP